MYPMHPVKFVLSTLFLIVSNFSHAYTVLPPLDQIDAYKVIQIEGLDIPNALGLQRQDLSLAAIVDDVMEPIPYQIDEYNTGGAVYFDGWDVPVSGALKSFDEADKLLFVYKDAGSRKPPQAFVDGEVVAEIELQGSDSHNRYVYLLKNSKLRSQEQYVRYSSELGRVETDFYSLTYDKENHLKWLDFTSWDFIGEPPLDSLKIRMEAGLVSSLAPTVLTNDDFVALPKGEVIGPIRTTSQLEITLWLANIPVMNISLQMHHYPKSLLYDVRVMMPRVRRQLLVDPVLSMSFEGNKLLGATIHTAKGPTVGGIVDGIIDENEQRMIESGVTISDNWIWVATQRNLDLVAFFEYIEEASAPISLQLMDSLDNDDPPERFPGQLPNLGYKILNFPNSGFFGFTVAMFAERSFSGQPEDFTSRLRTGPDVKINYLKP